MSLNIQGLLNNFTELRYVIKKKSPDICLLNETHITEDVNTAEIKITGYNIIRSDSFSSRTGGVVAYIKRNIKIGNIKCHASQLLWIASFDIQSRLKNTMICGMYLSASENKMNVLHELENWCEENCNGKNVIMTGDYNVNYMNNTVYKQKLTQIHDDIGCKQMINQPTRTTEYSSTIIDLCFTNLKNIRTEVSNDDQISDHSNIMAYVKCNAETENKCKKLKLLRNFNYENIINSITVWINQWPTIRNENVDIKTEWFSNNMSNTMRQFIYEKLINANDNDFFDEELETMRKHKNVLHKRAQYTRDHSDEWDQYRKYRNEYKEKINKKKYQSTQNKIENAMGNQKKTWKIIKEMLNSKEDDINYIENENGEIVDNAVDIGNKFNKYFLESITKINRDIPAVTYENNIVYDINNTFEFKKLRISEVKNILKQMKKQNNRDFQDISISFLIDSFDMTGLIITDLINSSFESSIFPSLLKKSVIVPIPKVNGTNKINEFRPINTLLSLEKVFEKCAYIQLKNFIQENNVLYEEQSGFRDAHSCESAINVVINEWKDIQQNNEIILAVFLDFKRAFETIDRNILILKLEKYGIGKQALDWCKSYLSDRKQCTRIGDVISEELLNEIGIQQGSIKGPLYFILYINDLIKSLKWCKMRLFADDSLVYLRTKNIEEGIEKINSDLNILYNIINQNKLMLNIEKTKSMIITNKKSIDKTQIKIKINNIVLENVTNMKYLGIIIDDGLTFKPNIDYVAKKVGRKIGVLSRLNNKFNMQQKIYIYKTIIEPHFNYCSTILFLSNKTDIQRLQKLQNKCLRNILRVNYNCSQNEILFITNQPSVYQIIFKNTMIIIYKMINKMWPEYMTKEIKFKHENERKNSLRCRNQLENKKATKLCSQNSLLYKGVNLFNKLPANIRLSENINIFVRQMKLYTQQNVNM